MTCLTIHTITLDDPGPGPPGRTRVDVRPLAFGEVAAVSEVFAGMATRSRLFRFLAPTPRPRGCGPLLDRQSDERSPIGAFVG
jgi:hypothetical protein